MVYIRANPPYTDPFTPYADGGGEFDVGDTATLSAHETPGNFFSHWTDGAGRNYYDNPLNVKVHDAEETYTAHFAEDEETEPEEEGEDPSGEKPKYTVTVSCENPGEGIVAGGGVFEQGDVCTISASENPATPDHKFVGWQNPGWDNPNGAVLKKRVHSFEVFDDESWVAIFDDAGPEGYDDWTDEDEYAYEYRKKNSRRTIHVYVGVVPAYDGDSSTASGGGSFYAGEPCTLTATPDTSVVRDNHLVLWKRTATNSSTAPALEIRTDNPYLFHVYAPDQYWWAVFGSGLTRVKVSSNLPMTPGNRLGGVAGIDTYNNFRYHYVSDKVFYAAPFGQFLSAATFLTSEVRSGFHISYLEYFNNPQDPDDTGIWFPEYLIERKSKKKVMYPFRDVSWFWNNVVERYQGKVYYAFADFYFDDELKDCGSTVDLYVHFVRFGQILRENGGDILRNAYRILRANDGA